MNRKTYFAAAAVVLAISSSHAARAATDFFVEAAPTWTRPTTNAQAQSSLTTYQAWNDFDSTQSPSFQNPANDPTSINPSGGAVASDSAAPGDGAFFIGSGTYQDIYSFSANLAPRVSVPQPSGVAAQAMNVMAQVQYYGSDIDLNDLTVLYTNANGVQQSVLADTLANYSVKNLYSVSSDVGFGEADQADYEWDFTVPNTSAFQLTWGWDVTSSALQDVAIDTQSVAGSSSSEPPVNTSPSAVPVPAAFWTGLIGLAGLVTARRAKKFLVA